MIVSMKKVSLICMTSHVEEMITRLSDLGVIHLVASNAPLERDIKEARTRLESASRALHALSAPESAPETSGHGRATFDLERITALLNEKEKVASTFHFLTEEQEKIAPFGSFDPSLIRLLRKYGLHIKLYHAPPGGRPESPSGVLIRVLKRDHTGTYFVAISTTPLALDVKEIALPRMSLDAMKTNIEAVRESLAEIDAEIAEHADAYGDIAAYVNQLRQDVFNLEAGSAMNAKGDLSYLVGYCPADTLEEVTRASRENGWAIMSEDPDPADSVPTLIRRSRFAQLIAPVFKFMDVLPGYRERDISPIFLVFFSIFFSIIVGDAGYGALFLVCTFLMRKQIRPLHPSLLPMLLLVSSGSIIWGILSSNYFAISRDHLPSLLSALTLQWFQDEHSLIMLCFLIGAVHLSLAHAWNAIQLGRSWLVLGQLGWLMVTWAMYFAARTLVLGDPFLAPAYYVLIAGAVLMLLFSIPWHEMKTHWIMQVMLPLNLLNSFVDVVSYIRLYAVGVATFAVGSAFNEMAADISRDTFLSGLGASIVLLIGHALNITLAMMGVLVHGIRLNMLEFAGRLGQQWNGIPYHPFRRGVQPFTEPGNS